MAKEYKRYAWDDFSSAYTSSDVDVDEPSRDNSNVGFREDNSPATPGLLDYVQAGDISGLAEYTNKNMNYRNIPYVGDFIGHTADSATGGVASLLKFVGNPFGSGDYLNDIVAQKAQEEKKQRGESINPSDVGVMEYITNQRGLARGAGDFTGSMLSMLAAGGVTRGALGLAAKGIGTLAGAERTARAVKAIDKIASKPWMNSFPAELAKQQVLAAPVEAAMEGGSKIFEAEQRGDSPEVAREKGNEVALKNLPMLMATNAVEGYVGGKVIGDILNGVKIAKNINPTASNFRKVVEPAARAMVAEVPAMAVGKAVNAYEEGGQEGISRSVEPDKPYSYNPLDWYNNPAYKEQRDAFEHGAIDMLPFDILGLGKVGYRNRGRVDRAEAETDTEVPNDAGRNIGKFKGADHKGNRTSQDAQAVETQFPVEQNDTIGDFAAFVRDTSTGPNIISLVSSMFSPRGEFVPSQENINILRAGVEHNEELRQLYALFMRNQSANAQATKSNTAEAIEQPADEPKNNLPAVWAGFAETVRDTAREPENIVTAYSMFDSKGEFVPSEENIKTLANGVETNDELKQLYASYLRYRQNDSAKGLPAPKQETVKQETQKETPRAAVQNTQGISNFTKAKMFYLNDGEMRRNLIAYAQTNGIGLSRKERSNIMKGEDKAVGKLLAKLQNKGVNLYAPDNSTETPNQSETSQSQSAENLNENTESRQTSEKTKVDDRKGSITQGLQEVSEYDDDGNVNPDVVSFLETASRQLTEGDGKAVSVVSSFIPEDIRRPVTQAIQRGELELAKEYIDEKLEELGGKPFAVDKSNEMDDTVEGTSVDDVDTPIGRNIKKFERHGIKLKTNETVEKYLKTLPEELRKKAFRLLYQKQDLIGVSDGTPITAGMTVADAIKVAVENPNLFSIKRYYNRDGRGISGHFLYNLTNKERVRLTALEYGYADYLKGSIKKSNKGVDKKNKQASDTAEDAASNETPTKEVPKDTSKQENEKNITAKMRGSEKQIKIATDIINGMCDTFRNHADEFEGDAVESIIDSINSAAEADVYAGDIIGKFKNRPTTDAAALFDKIVSASMPDEHNAFAIEIMRNLLRKHPELRETYTWIKDDTSSATAASDNNNTQPKEQKTENKVSANMFDNVINDKAVKDTATAAAKGNKAAQKAVDIAKKLPTAKEEKKATTTKAENKSDKVDLSGAFGNINDVDNDLASLADDLVGMGFNVGDKKPARPKVAKKLLNVVDDSDEALEKLIKEFTSITNKVSSNPVFNPELYVKALNIGMVYVQRGVNRFSDWANLMGKIDGMQDWINAIWDSINSYPEGEKFSPAVMTKLTKAVGTLYTNNITDLDAIQERIFNNLRIPATQQKRFAPIIESAYNGVKTFVDGQEVNANGQERRESESTQERPVDMEQAEVSDAGKERGHSGVSGEVPRRSGREGEGNTRTTQTGDTAGEDGTGRVREEAELEKTASEGDSAGGNKQSAPKLTPAQKNPSPEETPGHDYEIKKSITKKSEADRFKQNVAALKLLHELEVQGRMPTPKEQEILAGYNGCGGIKSAFVDGTKENKEMRELVSSGVITEEEYKSMRSTVNDAFYTSPDLVRAIWKGVSHLGFNGGRILDPAMGTGNFFGCMPRDMMKKSSLHGVEMDSLSSRFAKYLYPSAMVKNSPFQNADSPNNFFDLVITNVPFSSVTVDGYQVHNYYFANGIDKVRPGGLMVYITSQGSLNGSTDAAKMRSYLASKADMVAAFKLPEDTFTDAGAKVTTDVVIFRKRDNDGQKYKGAQNFLDVAYNRGGYGANINQYFLDNPSAVLGKLVNSRGQFGWEYSVKRNEAANTAEELEKAMRKLPKDVYKPVTRTGKKAFNSHEANKRARADEKTRDGELYIDKSGKPVQNEAGEAKPISGKNAPMVKAYIELKNTLKSLYQAQRDPNASDNVINAIRSNLNKQYDAFVKKYGHLNEEQVSKVVLSDPSAGMMMSLERFDTRKEKRGNRKVDVFSNWSKADIFTKRTVQAVRDVKTASSPSDALIASLGNKGYVDVDYMAELLGTTPEQIAEQLSGQIFKNPSTGAYESREEYLSGNVKEKLAQAQAAAKTDKAYERNVKELEAVIPADLVAEEIGVKLGSPWIPTPDIQEFVTFASGSRNLMVERLSQFGKWTVKGWGSPAKYKVEGIEFKDMLENVLNNKSVEIYDIVGRGKDAHKVLNQSKTDAANVVADKLKADFVTWLWSDKARKDRLVKFYNDNFNNEVLRKYDGSHLTFPGMNASITLRQHQKDVIWRMMQGVNTLIAHCVGTGKTFEMQAAGMEMRRLGIAQKPMYCLPNNVVEQFAREFRLLYPEAKLLVLDSSHLPSNIRTTKVEVTEDGRKVKTKLKLSERDKNRLPAVRAQRARTLSKIQSEDWDAVIISHNLFERFEVSPETRAEYIQEELDTLEQAISESKGGKIGDKRTLSNMEKKLASLKEALEEALSTPKEDIGITFEELGVDQLFVDEADLFKNLRTPSFLERMSGINTSSDAKRSRDMHMKTRWLTRMNGGRGVVFATGTPISNSLVEQYTMLRYLDEQGLNEKGMGFFDNWANAFCNFALDIERKPTGDGYRKVMRVTKFINQAEMKKMFRKVADVKTQEELVEAGLIKIPKLKNGKPTAIVLPVDEQVRRYIKEEVPDRIAKMKKGFDKEKGDDNMLALMGDLRKLSMTDKKIAACADMVAKTFFDTGDVKGAQLVFCDMGIPRAEKDTESTTDKEGAEVTEDKEDSSIYEKLINYLVDRGVPREQIAFAQQAKNKDELDAIFQKVDKGEIRILIGSTSKMGAGTNCQHHLVALHDLDAPWRPRDLDQRHGRIMRSGNQNAEVEIFNYILKDSFDAVMWEKLKNKAEVIAQAMNGDMSIRELDDTGLATLTYSEMENEATGNPLIKEQLKLEGEIKKQKNALQNFKRQQHEAEKQLESVLPLRVQENELEHRRIEDDIKNRKDTSGENFSMTIDGKTFTSRTEAQEALDAILSKTVSYTPVEIGSIGGFKVKAAKINGYAVNGDSVNDFKLTLNGNIEYNVNGATIRSIEAALKSAPDKALENNVRSGEIIHRLLQEAKDTVALEDNYSEKLRELEERLKVVQKQIEEELVDGGQKPQTEQQEVDNDDTDYSVSESDVSDKINFSVTSKKLLAPNGKPSNLTPKQYKQVRTKAFKEWFGDWENDPENASKVVDENGEPLVVYHGSKKKFEVFDKEKQSNGWLGKGFYFTTDKKEATQYGRIKYPCFLKLTKMFISTANSPNSFLSEIKESFNLRNYPSIGAEKHLQANGYDGVKFKYWDANGMIYTVFEPNQIKSATDNNGQFSKDNDDIRYSAFEGEDFDTPTVTIDELKENLDSFNLSHKQLGKDTIQVTLPNGEKLFVHVSEHDSLPLTEAEEKKARKAHGLAEGTPIKVNGSLKGNLITLARKGDKGTIYHELFHFAEKFLTKEERDFLSGLIGNKEKRADAFRDFINGKKFSGRLGKVFDTIRHACDVILAKIGVKASQKRLIFDKVSSGEVFKRTAESPIDKTWEAADNKENSEHSLSKRFPSNRPLQKNIANHTRSANSAHIVGDVGVSRLILDESYYSPYADETESERLERRVAELARFDPALLNGEETIEVLVPNENRRFIIAHLEENKLREFFRLKDLESNLLRRELGVKRNGTPETEGERICALFVLRGAIQYATRRIETDKELLPSVRRGLLSRVLRLDEWNYPTESQRVKDELRAEQVDFSITAIEDTKPSHSEKGGFSNAKVKAGTFFSGAGLVDYALRDVIDGQFAVEKDSAIAEAYALNHNGEVMFNGDVRDFKVGKHKGNVDYFHASPVCKNYSMAKRNVAFDEQVADNKVDITTAKATADAIRELQPKVFTLEQVKAYQGSKALKIITKALDDLGYHWDGNVYNAADYGAGTSRERFLLRAVKDGQLPSLPPKVDKKTGWLEAMEEAGVTLDSLPERPYDKDSEVYKAVKNTFPKNPDKPVLIQGRRFGESKVRYSPADEPAPAITASDHEYRILTPDGKFLDASPRVIAAISGLDKSFKLPKNKQLGYTVVGNGVPVKLTQAIFGNLLNDTLVNPVESDGMYFDAEGEGTLFGGDDTDYSISEVKEAKKDSDNILSRAMKSLKEKMSKDKNPEIQILAKQIDPNHIGLTDEWLTSPSRIAEKFTAFRQFFIFADKAMRKLQELRGLWNRRLDIALGYSKNKLSNEERSDLFKLLFMGDAEGKEYTAEEISMLGYGDNVAKAYKRVRSLMDTVYKALNDARTRVQTKTKTMTSDSLSDLLNTEVSKKMLAEDDAVSKLNNNKQNNFVEILRITENEDGKYTVSYKEKPNWKHKYEAITETALNKMAKDPAMNTGVAKEVGIDPDTGERLYDVEVWETIPNIRKLSGYIPHYFHEYMIRYKNIDKNGKEFYEVIGSGSTLKDAKKAADKWLEENPDAEASNVVIAPKSFDFIGQLGMNMANGVVIGDKDYFKMMQKIANQNDMTLAEAKDVLSGAVKQKNRHRFLGNFLHRKGAKGYDDNMEWVLRHYVNTSARYIALETEFKPQAISLYERVFGAFDNARNHTGLGGYAYDYINDVNGNPSEFEKKLNNILNGDGWVGKIWQSAIKGLNWMGGDWGDRAALELSNKVTGLVAIAKLGFFNISSALVNFTQLANSAAYIGDVSALMKAMAKGARRKYSVRDMRILVDSGVLFDIGLESASGYNNTTVSGKVGRALSKSMVFFQTSEGIVRRGTILAAYDKGREKGMTHDEAIAYAQEINRKANFEYGVHDAPNMFRRTGVLGQFLFQFKKYAIKEWEVMSDMMPLFSNKTSLKQKSIFWGYYFLLSGLFQIPFFDAFDDLFFGGKLKRNAKKCIMEVTAGNKALEPLAKVAMYGIGAVANADISRRVGQGDILPTSASDLLGPTGSTIAQMWKYGSSNPIASLRAFSPGLANIVQAGMGYSVGKRGRKLQEYNSYYDKALKAIGIRSVDESIASDTEDIVKAERREKRDKDSALIDDYIKAREENDSKKMGEYAREMKARGITKKRVLNEIENKKLDKKSRTRKSLNKKEQREYRNLFRFGQ